MQSQADYYRLREKVERIAARNAASEAARKVHAELARQYAELVRREEPPMVAEQPIITLV